MQLLFLIGILRLCFSGIDFTDEGKYLNDSFAPSQFTDLVTHYGYVYHPIFRALDFNIPAFRMINVLITVLVASIATHRSLKEFSFLSKLSKLSISISIGLISLSFLSVYWLSTPSYNSLTLQSLLLCWIFFLNHIEKTGKKEHLVNSILLAMSCVLLFLAKPSSFLILHLIAFLYTLASKGFISGLKSIAIHITLVTSVLFLFSVIVYESPIEILFKVFRGYHNINLLTIDSYTLIGFLENVRISDPILLSFIIASISFVMIRLRPRFLTGYMGKATLSFFATVFLLSISFLMIYFATTQTLSMFLFLIPVSFAYIWACAYSPKSDTGAKKRHLYLLLLIPFVGAAGTGNNLFTHSQYFFVFVVLFSILITAKRISARNSELILQTISICLVCLTAVVLFVAAKTPYRQVSSLFANSFTLSTDSTVRYLKVDYSTSKSYSTMVKSVVDSDFQPGDGIIDLTGQSPAIAFLIGAKPMGDSWLLGGYPGSNEFAIRKLMDLSCREKVSSYLLVEPDGPLSLNVEYILMSIGLDYSKYSPVSSWIAPKGAGGFVEERNLLLLKPNYLEGYCS